MNFVFKNGIGQGTYNTDEYRFEGTIKGTENDDTAYHGKCIFWYFDNEVEEEEHEEGVMSSRVIWHKHEDWRWTQVGQFERDQYDKIYLINGTFSGNDDFYSLIDIKVENKIGTG